jgi:hypothetical protein
VNLLRAQQLRAPAVAPRRSTTAGVTARTSSAEEELDQVRTRLATLRAEESALESVRTDGADAIDRRLDALAATFALDGDADAYDRRRREALAARDDAEAATDRMQRAIAGLEARGLELVDAINEAEQVVRAERVAQAAAAEAEAALTMSRRRAERIEAEKELDDLRHEAARRRAEFSEPARRSLNDQQRSDAAIVQWAAAQGGGPSVLSQVRPELHEAVLERAARIHG